MRKVHGSISYFIKAVGRNHEGQVYGIHSSLSVHRVFPPEMFILRQVLCYLPHRCQFPLDISVKAKAEEAILLWLHKELRSSAVNHAYFQIFQTQLQAFNSEILPSQLLYVIYTLGSNETIAQFFTFNIKHRCFYHKLYYQDNNFCEHRLK